MIVFLAVGVKITASLGVIEASRCFAIGGTRAMGEEAERAGGTGAPFSMHMNSIPFVGIPASSCRIY